MVDRHGPDREFHISRLARERYGIDEGLFALRGGVVIANFHAARVLGIDRRSLYRRLEDSNATDPRT